MKHGMVQIQYGNISTKSSNISSNIKYAKTCQDLVIFFDGFVWDVAVSIVHEGIVI